MKWQGYFNSRMGWKLVKEDFPDSFNRNDVISAFEGRYGGEVTNVNHQPRG